VPIPRYGNWGPHRMFFRGLSNFAQYCKGKVSEASNGSKEQFPASAFDGLPSLLEKALLGPQHRESRQTMRAFYEKLGVLGPIYRLVGEDFSDREIAGQLRLSELVITNCIAWMLHSLKIADRAMLVGDAFSAAHASASGGSLRAA
jgi:hypothetical protein